MTWWHFALSFGAALIVFLLARRRERSNLTEIDHTQEPAPAELVDGDLDQRIVHTLHAFGKIQAVKDLRAATGWSLKQSKDHVEELERTHPLPDKQT